MPEQLTSTELSTIQDKARQLLRESDLSKSDRAAITKFLPAAAGLAARLYLRESARADAAVTVAA